MVGRKRGMIETAERDLWFAFTSDGTNSQTAHIDLAQCLSLVNRRFYRQGMQYAIDGLELHSSDVVQVNISRLPDTWVLASAWEKCMRAWMRQQDEALDMADKESLKARYRDFKIHMDELHMIATFASNKLPFGVPDLSALPADVHYDWDPSQIVIPNDGAVGNTTERYFHMIGADSAAPGVSAGMIHAYAESRSRPQSFDPNTVGPSSNLGGVLGEMFDVGDDDSDVIQNARTHNFATPYPTGYFSTSEYYPGGSVMIDNLQLETIMNVRATAPAGTTGAALGTTFAPGFLANCGLIQVQLSAFSDTDIVYLRIGVAPGDYKGVAARSMAVVN